MDKMPRGRILGTGIPGLDFLLGGGFECSPGGSLSILVKGGPGSGKTILALQMATNFAKHEAGAAVVYYCLEQDPRELDALIGRFGWRVDGTPEVGYLKDANEGMLGAAGGGTIVFASAPSGSMEDAIDWIAKQWDEILRPRYGDRLKLAVVDSVNVIEGGVRREHFRQLASLFCNENVSALFIYEDAEFGREHASPLEFAGHAVIELGWEPKAGLYSKRFLDIRKCRCQAHYRGRHVFSIVGEAGKDVLRRPLQTGINVFPSIAALLAGEHARRRETNAGGRAEAERELPCRRARCETAIDGLDSMLRGGLCAGSSTLLVGAPGTKKNILGLHFLAAGVKRGERGMLITFRRDQGAVEETASNYSFLREQLLDRPDGLCRIVEVPPGYHTPEYVIDCIMAWIREAQEGRDGQQPYRRLVFEDVAQIPVRFPLIAADKMFVPALVELCRRNDITAMYIDVARAGEPAEQRPRSELAGVVDNIIATYSFSVYGRETTGIRVLRTRDGEFDGELKELSAIGRKVDVSSTFQGFTGLTQESPKPVDVLVRLYGGGLADEAYVADVERLMKPAFAPGQIHFDSFKGPEYEQICPGVRLQAGVPRSDTVVMCIDTHWVRRLAAAGALEPLDGFLEEPLWEGGASAARLYHQEALKCATLGASWFAVPYYLDLGLLCYRKDILPDLHQQAPSSWAGILQLAQGVKLGRERREPIPRWPFDFDRIAEEAINCMVIEVLYSLGGRLFKDPSDPETITLGDDGHPEMLETFRLLRSLVDPELLKPPNGDPRARFDAVLWRHWYSTLGDMLRFAEGKLDEKVGILPLPGPRMCGTWYLAILKGSVSPIAGWRVIKELSSVEANRQRLMRPVGLPSLQAFYEENGMFRTRDPEATVESLLPSYDNQYLIFRQDISDFYEELSPIFLTRFTEILRLPTTADDSEVKRILRETRDEIVQVGKILKSQDDPR